MKRTLKWLWGWTKLIWWLLALIIYAVVAGGAFAISFFMPRGSIFGRR